MKNLVKKTEEQLFKYLARKFKGSAYVSEGEYILVEGELPVLLVAHLDTVHSETVKDICSNGNIFMSPQGIGGDDRCGVYALLKVWEKKKPHLLFTCQEEVGGIGAYSFAEDYENGVLPTFLDTIDFIIEVDRKGNKEAVYYECENKSFNRIWQKEGFVEKTGSFSDICYIAPALGVAAVNLSAGYENAHTLHEYINMKWLNNTIQSIIRVLSRPTKRYKYIQSTWARRSKYQFLWEDNWDKWDYTNTYKELK